MFHRDGPFTKNVSFVGAQKKLVNNPFKADNLVSMMITLVVDLDAAEGNYECTFGVNDGVSEKLEYSIKQARYT